MKVIRLAAIVALSAFALRAELVGTIRVDVQGTATNATAISGGALGTVGGIVGTSTVARAAQAVTVTGGQSNTIATAVQPAALAGYLPLTGGTMLGALDTGENDLEVWKLTNRNDPTFYWDMIANGFVAGGVRSIGLGTRILYDADGMHALDWGNRAFYGPDNPASVLTWDNDGAYVGGLIIASRTYATTNAAAQVAAHAAAADPHADRAYAAGLVSTGTVAHAGVKASAGALGHVRVGSGLAIDGDGILSATGGATAKWRALVPKTATGGASFAYGGNALISLGNTDASLLRYEWPSGQSSVNLAIVSAPAGTIGMNWPGAHAAWRIAGYNATTTPATETVYTNAITVSASNRGGPWTTNYVTVAWGADSHAATQIRAYRVIDAGNTNSVASHLFFSMYVVE